MQWRAELQRAHGRLFIALHGGARATARAWLLGRFLRRRIHSKVNEATRQTSRRSSPLVSAAYFLSPAIAGGVRHD